MSNNLSTWRKSILILLLTKESRVLKNSCIGEGESGEQVREVGIKSRGFGNIDSTSSKQGGGPHAQSHPVTLLRGCALLYTTPHQYYNHTNYHARDHSH